MTTAFVEGAAPIPPAAEIRALTGLRGLAAVYVVVLHYVGPSPAQAFSSPFTTFLGHGYLAVDLFFVLSGFVMALNYCHMFDSGWSREAHLRFLGRRIARVYPLYFAGTVAGFILALAGWNEYLSSPLNGLSLFYNLIMVQAWGLVRSLDIPGWSVSAEWAAYLLFPALIVPTMFRRPSLAWLCALICAVTLGVLCVIPSTLVRGTQTPEALLDFWAPRFAFPVLRCLTEFSLGILSFRLARTAFSVRIGSGQLLPAALCVLIAVLMAFPKTDLVVALLFPLLVVSMASGSHLPGRLLASAPAEMLGKLSYSLYLTHALLLGPLHWAKGLAHAAGLCHAQTYAALFAIALTFPIAYLAYNAIEVPGRRLLRKLFEGRSIQTVVPTVNRNALVDPGAELGLRSDLQCI